MPCARVHLTELEPESFQKKNIVPFAQNKNKKTRKTKTKKMYPESIITKKKKRNGAEKKG